MERDEYINKGIFHGGKLKQRNLLGLSTSCPLLSKLKAYTKGDNEDVSYKWQKGIKPEAHPCGE